MTKREVQAARLRELLAKPEEALTPQERGELYNHALGRGLVPPRDARVRANAADEKWWGGEGGVSPCGVARAAHDLRIITDAAIERLRRYAAWEEDQRHMVRREESE